MANKACPRCGSFTWWWRDDSGCSSCVQPEAPIARRMEPSPALTFHPDAFSLTVAPLLTEADCDAFLRRIDEEFGGDCDVV